MRKAIAEQEEILAPATVQKIASSIPFVNIISQLEEFFKAAIIKLEIDKTSLAQLESEEPSQFEQEREASDEAARQRDLESRAIDAEYFRLIREGKFEEAQELLNLELKGGKTNE